MVLGLQPLFVAIKASSAAFHAFSTEPTIVADCFGSARELPYISTAFLRERFCCSIRSLMAVTQFKIGVPESLRQGNGRYAEDLLSSSNRLVSCTVPRWSRMDQPKPCSAFSCLLTVTNHCSRFAGMTDCLGAAARVCAQNCAQNGCNSQERVTTSVRMA